MCNSVESVLLVCFAVIVVVIFTSTQLVRVCLYSSARDQTVGLKFPKQFSAMTKSIKYKSDVFMFI